MNLRVTSLSLLATGCLGLLLDSACSRHSSGGQSQTASPANSTSPAQGSEANLAPAGGGPATAEVASGAPVPLDTLKKLVGPIALYPDPLIALVLPASTMPADLAAAAQYLAGNGDPSQVDNQPWDPSVRGLAHYPTVLEWMAQNPDWTQSLGAAFASDPSGVMNAIQQLRAMAKAAGTLSDTPQQQIVDEGGSIAIEPADPDVIYVPSYDPDVVFAGNPYDGYGGPYLTFGIGYPVGFWLGYGFDWDRHALWFGDWRNWHNGGGWGHPVFPGQRGYVSAAYDHPWRPSANAPQARFSLSEHAAIARPGPMPGAPRAPEAERRVPAAPAFDSRAAPSPSEHFALPATPAPRIEDRQQFREPAPGNRAEDRAVYSAPRAYSSPDHSRAPAPERREAPPRGGGGDRDRNPR